jgi:hypothetical protein
LSIGFAVGLATIETFSGIKKKDFPLLLLKRLDGGYATSKTAR